MPKPAVILVRPREEGNIGSVARAMANMGLERLILVEPAPVLAGVAKGFGVGGWHILDAVERQPDLSTALAPFQRIVATASTRARKFRGRPVLEPRELPPLLAEDSPEVSTALVFGPEDNGLSTEDLAHCGTLVNIPTAPAHPTLNLAQAVLILAYELQLATPGEHLESSQPVTPAEQPASSGDLDRLIHHVATLLEGTRYPTGAKTRATLRDLRRLAARSAPSLSETRLVRRLCLHLIATLPEQKEPFDRPASTKEPTGR